MKPSRADLEAANVLTVLTLLLGHKPTHLRHMDAQGALSTSQVVKTSVGEGRRNKSGDATASALRQCTKKAASRPLTPRQTSLHALAICTYIGLGRVLVLDDSRVPGRAEGDNISYHNDHANADNDQLHYVREEAHCSPNTPVRTRKVRAAQPMDPRRGTLVNNAASGETVPEEDFSEMPY